MSSSDSEDDYAKYGTPLELLEEDEIPKKKPCWVEDQVATDKRGRRVFHGAFTGGFSAGFFNTVGTLEGWTPSTFKSSKSEKRKLLIQKPEDFMDEEDFSEFGIAPVVLKARQDYVDEKKLACSNFHNLHFGKYVLKDLLRPVRETVGIKLLRKMGWKPGQGVGPRITSVEKKNKQEARKKIYGCSLPSEEEEEEDQNELAINSDLEWNNIKYAPRDCEPFVFGPKDNIHGIGYQGLDKKSILSCSNTEEDSWGKKNKCLRSCSQAFGVGALEEEDEDIFLREDMSCYDFSLGNEIQQEATVKVSENLEGILNGFVPGMKRTLKKHYLLPILPKHYNPQKYLHNVIHNSCENFSRNKTSRWNKINCAEDQIIAEQGIENMFKENSRFPSLRENSFEGNKSKLNHQNITLTDVMISKVNIVTSKFKPFSNDSEKQKRYEKYLKLKEIGKTDFLTDIQPVSMTDREKEKEKVEFEKAAALFKPLNSMEDRFQSASQPEDVSDPLEVIQKIHLEEDDRAKAAAMNMFGTLTRRIQEWTPNHSLCKRFNLPEPKIRETQSLEKKTQKISIFDTFGSSYCNPDVIILSNVNKTLDEPRQKLLDELPEESDLNCLKEEETTLAAEKTDLFKAIFLISDSEEDKESERDKVNSKKNLSEKIDKTELSYEEKVINRERNDSLPSGIFENIDLELLTVREAGMTSKNQDGGEMDKDETLFLKSVYGPKLPEKVTVKFSCINSKNIVNNENWVEKKIHRKKKKKKEKKEKKSKYKSKHRHKRKK